ncbi:2Fe-2S iron-sulfur cluster-binding protein [Pseudanabaena sp. FACHB-2040]|uniref:2Fe-2S iron-sulfur cluster-binding protein n=1 Tax=Pseudanabaena sp. FACHB-2040 TaxID=2692859 RepID=UPI00168672D0|nr:2Fe-2S iron-sulfur cluster-binding protein [Pseudanabaena sp. FACHB-2040]MBD2257110.1 (2Fe-2S)-binding protein [Pseudanabaena sp. FACHB-2040]
MFRRITHHPEIELPDLGRPVTFSFNGKTLTAFEGDTVTSALLANGIRLFSRSFKFHRPRSVYDGHGQGPETLVTVDNTPNELADRISVREGMQVRTQNAWPSVEFDLMAINGWVVPRLPNLFYYKLFHKPKWLWPLAERVIRRIAGLGEVDRQAGENEVRYEKRYRFPDVCVVGGGPAGLAAAQAALAAGRQVLLIDDRPQLGGHALHSIALVQNCREAVLNQLPEYEAVHQLADCLKDHPRLEILRNTAVFGLYEDNLVAAQQGNDLFKIRAGAVVLAPGATDRHLVFENNDLPGILTARGVERLIAGHRLAVGENAVVVTCHDGGYHTALLMLGAGTRVQAVVDARPEGTPGPFEQRLSQLGIPIYREQTIQAAYGDSWVASIDIGSLDGRSCLRSFACDLVAIAVGLKPQLNLLSAGRYRPVWDSQRQVFRIPELPPGLYAAGDVNGTASFAQLYEEGWLAGTAAAQGSPQPLSTRQATDLIPALPADIESGGSHHIICKCMDVTRQEVRCSIAEGFDAVETLKRYTSMGMGPCQGKQCYEAVARLAAQDTGLPAEMAVPTTLRPPFAPVSFGVLAGRSYHLQPIQRTPMHLCHKQAGATFLEAGRWQRPYAYGDPGLEALHVRQHLGLIDISTLGKLELSGPDALNFLQFLLPGKYGKLAVGRTRYSIMVGEDGILFEDGTLSRLEENRYYLTTTTGNQEAINALFQWWLTVEPFDVRFKNLSAVYAAVNVTGPMARDFLQPLVDIDLANPAFPYMSSRQAQIAGIPALMFRIGFTGELGYELHFPAEYGEALWNFLLEQGRPLQIKPFGVEAQRILRLEKGHLIPGVDTDALTNPYEAGLSFAVKTDKPSFVGKTALSAFQQRGIETRLVPFMLNHAQDPVPEDGVVAFSEGKVIGRITSSRRSPTLDKGIGLAWLAEELAQPEREFTIRLGSGQQVQATVLAQAAYDPDGTRLTS